MAYILPAFLGWSSWSAWTICNSDGERQRVRKCLKTDPSPKECQGNEREIRICNADPLQTAGLATGTIIAGCFLLVIAASGASAFVMYTFMKKRLVPRDIKSIGSPCFDSFPNQYSSLPTKDERPKVKRQTSFNSGGSAGIGNASSAAVKLLSNGTLTKSNNVTGCQTPKVLAKGNYVDVDTATIKRNSNGLNNVRPMRTSVDDDKF